MHRANTVAQPVAPGQLLRGPRADLTASRRTPVWPGLLRRRRAFASPDSRRRKRRLQPGRADPGELREAAGPRLSPRNGGRRISAPRVKLRVATRREGVARSPEEVITGTRGSRRGTVGFSTRRILVQIRHGEVAPPRLSVQIGRLELTRRPI